MNETKQLVRMAVDAVVVPAFFLGAGIGCIGVSTVEVLIPGPDICVALGYLAGVAFLIKGYLEHAHYLKTIRAMGFWK